MFKIFFYVFTLKANNVKTLKLKVMFYQNPDIVR